MDGPAPDAADQDPDDAQGQEVQAEQVDIAGPLLVDEVDDQRAEGGAEDPGDQLQASCRPGPGKR